MKKLVIFGTALLSLNLVASEFQIKLGYDFYRKVNSDKNFIDRNIRLDKGAVAGFEYLFDNQGEFEWGIGAEYKFGDGSSSLTKKDPQFNIYNNFVSYNNGWLPFSRSGSFKLGRNIPVYTVGKFNVITSDSGKDRLYVVGRLGYSFVNNNMEDVQLRNVLVSYDMDGGLYGAIGLGTEIGNFTLEALYERTYFSIKQTTTITNASRFGSIGDVSVIKANTHLDSFGLRLGYRFGNLVNDRRPQIVTREVVRTEVREVPVNVPVSTPVVRTQNTRTAVLPFNCSAEEQKCVIRGFKVDGRVPNESEARDLGTIANVINQFAEGGSIDFVGHTDSTGSAAYNQKLSVARAQNVARLLREYGLKDTITYGKITGKGLTEPVDTNSTVEGRYNNRRVELFFNNVDFSNVEFINQ